VGAGGGRKDDLHVGLRSHGDGCDDILSRQCDESEMKTEWCVCCGELEMRSLRSWP
jgi:hypothetical protein